MLSLLLLAGCGGVGTSGHEVLPHRLGIGWIDHAWRTCEEGMSCPRPSPKTIAVPVAPAPPLQRTEPAEQVAPVVDIRHATAVVHFTFARTKPTQAGVAELESALASIHDGETLRMTGYTDDVGSPAINEHLARQRAIFVAAWLKQRGIANPVQIEAHAKCCYVTANDHSTGRAANRRVEIEFIPSAKEIHP